MNSSDFNTALILGLAKKSPGASKKQLADSVEAYLDYSNGRSILSQIHALTDLKLIVQHDYKCYLTPRGEEYLKQLREALIPAMNFLLLGC